MPDCHRGFTTNPPTHEVWPHLCPKPEDARAIRLRPGELACRITDLAVIFGRTHQLPSRSTAFSLQEDSLLLFGRRLTFSLHCTTGFGAGMKFAVNYHYYPLGRFARAARQVSRAAGANDLKA